jgi:hypothetical protein
VLTADIWSSGAASQRNTVGFRTGANPLFEMGMYNAFDNDVNGPLATSASGIGVRILNLAGGSALSGQRWVLLGDVYEGWARWQAIFTEVGLAVRVDEGMDNTWDVTYISGGTTPVGPFSDLRFGGPSALPSPGGGFAVDNVKLEVVPAVPEPSTAALLVLGALAVVTRRRASR